MMWRRFSSAKTLFIHSSFAFEIVAGSRMAELRPALGAPILDKYQAANMGLEPLGLAHLGVGRVPNHRQKGISPEAHLGLAFKKLKSAFGSANVEVNTTK